MLSPHRAHSGLINPTYRWSENAVGEDVVPVFVTWRSAESGADGDLAYTVAHLGCKYTSKEAVS